MISESSHINDDAILGPVGNRLYSFGDGTAEAVMSEKGLFTGQTVGLRERIFRRIS